MMKKLMISAALGAMLVAGGVAAAQNAAPAPGAMPRHGLPGDANGDGKVTKAELTASLQERFAKMDLNGDGKITKEERDQLREKRFDDRFAKMDADHNGQISKDEMKVAHEARGERRGGPDGPGKRHHGRMGMKGGGMMGADKDGVITREAFMARPLAMFEKADANKDGTVTAEEAKAAWAQFGKGRGPGKWGEGKWGRGGPGGPQGDTPPPPPSK